MQSSVGQICWKSLIFENKVEPIVWGLVNMQNFDDRSICDVQGFKQYTNIGQKMRNPLQTFFLRKGEAVLI